MFFNWTSRALKKSGGEDWLSALTVFSLALIVSISVPAYFEFGENVMSRNIMWEFGDAPIAGMYDISSEWVMNCAGGIENPFWGNMNSRLGSNFAD